MIKNTFELQNPWRFDSDYAFPLHQRKIMNTLIDQLNNKKIIGLIGSRQVGKSALIYLLIQHLLKQKISTNNIYYFNLDDLKLHELLNNISEFLWFIGNNKERKFIFLDEVQRLQNPGLFLKELYDLHLNIKIIYSGSSQLEIKARLKEHLVGRARQFEIHRLSFTEYLQFNHPISKEEAIHDIMLYGSYPAVALSQNPMDKRLEMKDIFQSYIEKDLVDFLKIDNIQAFNMLLGILANQTGQLLNIDNLSKTVRIPRKEVEHYLTVLEKTFIIRRIYPFYKNYSKEISKTPKIYFLDLGLRNYLINNFNDFTLRNDQGNLFENFYLLELLANDFYDFQKINYWRTTNQTEIDFIVAKEGEQMAIETKWANETTPKSFITIKKYYPNMKTKVISKNTFLESILK